MATGAGRPRAWLSTIARNAFYAHARRASTRAEIPLDFDPNSDDSASNGSSLHLDCIQLREAISHLSPALRTTLIMKHYGGFTYEEIAEREGCPAGTARRRVWAAMKKLRAALAGIGEETEMTCDGLRGTLILDFINGALAERRAPDVAFEIHDLPWTGAGERARDLFIKAEVTRRHGPDASRRTSNCGPPTFRAVSEISLPWRTETPKLKADPSPRSG